VNVCATLIAACTLSVMVACQSSRDMGGRDVFSQEEALALAVQLANAACLEQYGTEPFDEDSYPVVFADGRWRWGDLDVHGEHGFSAIVTFGPRGEHPGVEIFLSIDTPTPSRE
jgi:hypothetical protein